MSWLFGTHPLGRGALFSLDAMGRGLILPQLNVTGFFLLSMGGLTLWKEWMRGGLWVRGEGSRGGEGEETVVDM